MTIYKRLLNRLATSGTAKYESPEAKVLRDTLVKLCAAMNRPRVLELGTKRSIASRSTRHDDWVPGAGEYLGTDIEKGEDVDIVADVHRLTRVTGEEQFDVVISCSTFEHLKYPHLAAHEIMKALRVGGLLYIQTHQSFPLHAFPYDYFRFSREALAGLFGTRMGFHMLGTAHEFPAKIFSVEAPETADHPCFLNACLLGEKTAKTPAEYVYEYDVA
jgi:SAM-dependent methyltransferase